MTIAREDFEITNPSDNILAPGKRHHVQIVTTYQHASGKYRMRVTTLGGPWHSDPSNVGFGLSFGGWNLAIGSRLVLSSSHRITSNLPFLSIPSHPIPSHPIASHPIRSHPYPQHPPNPHPNTTQHNKPQHMPVSVSFDQEAAAVLVARLAVRRLEEGEEQNVILRWIDRSLIRLTTKFADYRRDDVGFEQSQSCR